MEENLVQSKEQPQPPHDLRLASQPIEMQKRVINRLWERMTQLYGHRHQSAWGQSVDANGNLTDTADLWLQGLGRYSMDEIKNGITKLIEKGQEWPPTLPEFMHLCKPKRLAPYHRMAQALPAPTVDRSIVMAELKKIRARRAA